MTARTLPPPVDITEDGNVSMMEWVYGDTIRIRAQLYPRLYLATPLINTFPEIVSGHMSPYPTVVMVMAAHQNVAGMLV